MGLAVQLHLRVGSPSANYRPAAAVEGGAAALRVFDSHGLTILAVLLGLAHNGVNLLGALFWPEATRLHHISTKSGEAQL